MPANETLAWWSGGGALIGLGAWAIVAITHWRTPFGSAHGWDPPPVEVPGFTPPGEDDRKWTSPRMAVRMTFGGALGGALLGWWLAAADQFDARLQLLAEAFVVAGAAWVLVRTMRDTPAVGEAPPDNPEEALGVRVRNAALKLLAAGFMLGMVWLTLD